MKSAPDESRGPFDIPTDERYTRSPIDIMMRRFIALILLAIPALDLVTPGICPEDLQGFTLSPGFQRQMTPTPEALTIGQVPSSDQPERPAAPIDEDCFCCCQHITPQPIFIWLPPALRPDLTRRELPPFLALSIDLLDHPPRRS